MTPPSSEFRLIHTRDPNFGTPQADRCADSALMSEGCRKPSRKSMVSPKEQMIVLNPSRLVWGPFRGIITERLIRE
jgi:hypothetical protein